MNRGSDTHYVDADEPGKVKRKALCGAYVRDRDHSLTPTCPQCQQGLKARQESDDDHD